MMLRMKGIRTGLALLIALSATAQDWSRFRGPNGQGVSETTGLPSEFGPSKNLLWKTDLPPGHSSPVIAGNRIFVTGSEGDKLITICLDADTGRTLWRRDLTRARVSPIYKPNLPATPSPVTDGKNVYVFFAEFGLLSYDSSGRERWRLPLGPFDTFYGLGASPTLAGDTLLLNCDTKTKAFLMAVDSASGRIRWRIARPDVFDGYASPVVWEKQVLILGSSRVDAYALSTGEHVWSVRGLASLPVGSPALGPGLAYVATWGSDTPAGPAWEDWIKKDTDNDGRLSKEETKFDEFGAIDRNGDGFLDRAEWDGLRNLSAGDYGMVAVRLTPEARGDITASAIAWRDKKNYDSMTTPLVYRDVLYVVKRGGIIASLSPQTGEPFKVDRTKEAMEGYFASPVAADGKVFLVSESGKVTVLKAGQQWEILAVNDLGEPVFATPALAGGRIVIRTQRALYSFATRSAR